MGLVLDAEGALGSKRSKRCIMHFTNDFPIIRQTLPGPLPDSLCIACCRYSAVVNDNVITHLNVEPDGSGLTCSLANVVLNQLKES